jgi:hypothetical protein
MTTVYALHRAAAPRLRATAEFVVVLISAELLVATTVACGVSAITGIEDQAMTWPPPASTFCSGAPGSGTSLTPFAKDLICCIQPSQN